MAGTAAMPGIALAMGCYLIIQRFIYRPTSSQLDANLQLRLALNNVERSLLQVYNFQSHLVNGNENTQNSTSIVSGQQLLLTDTRIGSNYTDHRYENIMSNGSFRHIGNVSQSINIDNKLLYRGLGISYPSFTSTASETSAINSNLINNFIPENNSNAVYSKSMSGDLLLSPYSSQLYNTFDIQSLPSTPLPNYSYINHQRQGYAHTYVSGFI